MPPSGMLRTSSDAHVSGSGGSNKRRTTITAQTGQWALGKTIGAGSMGKVKLAKNLETGEQVSKYTIHKTICMEVIPNVLGLIGCCQDCPQTVYR